MPNWCDNIINISGTEGQIKRLVKTKKDWADPEHSDFSTESKSHLTVRMSTRWAPPVGLFEDLFESGMGVDAIYFEFNERLCGGYTDGKWWEVDLQRIAKNKKSLRSFLSNDPVGRSFFEAFSSILYC